jgi:hypothetical protein
MQICCGWRQPLAKVVKATDFLPLPQGKTEHDIATLPVVPDTPIFRACPHCLALWDQTKHFAHCWEATCRCYLNSPFSKFVKPHFVEQKGNKWRCPCATYREPGAFDYTRDCERWLTEEEIRQHVQDHLDGLQIVKDGAPMYLLPDLFNKNTYATDFVHALNGQFVRQKGDDKLPQPILPNEVAALQKEAIELRKVIPQLEADLELALSSTGEITLGRLFETHTTRLKQIEIALPKEQDPPD